MTGKFLLLVLPAVVAISCGTAKFDVDDALDYCAAQVEKALPALTDDNKIPDNILSGSESKDWNCSTFGSWKSGFWPGILWYSYEYTGDETTRQQAERFTRALYPIAAKKAGNHDIGFQIYCSLGNGYRITQNPEYREIMLRAADSLATLYNPLVGTICSWPYQKQWPHNTIIDNMMNLELLFWAARNGGGRELYDIAFRHAEVTMHNHFREDFSAYHVVVYDAVTGERLQRITHQGYADETMWARGQAWAVYGFTMAYRETGDAEFLETAVRAVDIFLKNLPEDRVPYWDFNAPDSPDAPKDASAAAIVASALLELQGFVDPERAAFYRDSAVDILVSLSSEAYRSGETNNAFLLHSTGHKPGGSEIDASIVYADYYYLEALMRLKKM
jgi:unsaturated chondroitin disaccharide hydrolase